MLRGIRRQDINREVKGNNTCVKTFPGATVGHMKLRVIPSLEMDPDEIIFICGTNNLRNDHPNQVAIEIIELAVNTKNKVRKVAVSSIVQRADSLKLDVKRMNVSRILEQELPKHGIYFNNNDNIQDRNLDSWELHLNYTGKSLITGNFINLSSNASLTS